jgi:hypothetical protein
MDSYDREEQISRLEKRYVAARSALAQCRGEFELLSRAPLESPARLAFLANEVERLTRERALLGERLVALEDAVV